MRIPIYYAPDSDGAESASVTTDAAASAATQQPAESTATADASTRETPAGSEDRYKGWIPPDAHERVVDGFHKRYDAVSWANGLDRQEVEDALALHRRAATTSTQASEPQPDAKDERGDPYYSPKQAAAWAAWEADRIVSAKLADFEDRFGPIESTFARSQQMEMLSSQIDTAKTWPGFADHIDDITKAITAARANGQRLSLHEAYISVVVPTLAASKDTLVAEEKKKWLVELNQTNTVARDDVNPNRVASASRKDIRDMDPVEAVREVRKELAAKRKAS